MIGKKGDKKKAKTGKIFNENDYPNVQTRCGTTDYTNLKSIYLYFSCWTTFEAKDMEKLGVLS